MDVYTISDWSISSHPDDNPYTPPEMLGKSLAGVAQDGRRIVTSRVRARVAADTYRTASGTLYRLIGEPAGAYVRWCQEHDLSLDPENPLKMAICSEAA